MRNLSSFVFYPFILYPFTPFPIVYALSLRSHRVLLPTEKGQSRKDRPERRE